MNMLKGILITLMILFSNMALSGTLDNAKESMRNGDYVDAAMLLRPIALNGSVEAQYLMGLMSNNAGPVIDFKAARKWYRKAARNGHVQSMFNLAILNSEDHGGDYYNDDGIKWFKKAAEAGHSEAQYHLSLIFARSFGWRYDIKRSQNWYDRAIDSGYVIESKIPLDELDK